MICPQHASTSENELSEESSETNHEAVYVSSNSYNTVEKQPMKPPKRPISINMRPSEPSEIQAAVNEFKELNSTLTMSVPSPRASEDECDIVGRHVAMQLKQLHPVDIIDATDEIQAILSRYRKKALKQLENRNVYTPSNNSYSSTPSPQPSTITKSYYQSVEPSVSAYGTTEHSLQSTSNNDIITTAMAFSDLIN